MQVSSSSGDRPERSKKQRRGAEASEEETAHYGVVMRDFRGLSDEKTGVVEIAPEVARSILETCRYPRQRRVDRKWVLLLATAMRKGEFEASAIQLHHLGTDQFLTDGQHRLHAIVEYGKPVPLVVVHKHVDSMDAVDRAYRRTDIGHLRSVGQQLATEGLAEELGMNPTHVRYLSQGAIVLADGFESERPSCDWTMRSCELRIRGVRTLAPEGKVYFAAIKGAPQGIAQRLGASAVLGVALVTLHYQREKAEPFWLAVAANDELRRGSGHYALSGLLASTGMLSVPANDYSRRVASCWNAHFDGRDLIAARGIQGTQSPIHIKGSPYSRDRKPIKLDFLTGWPEK